jgi:hypothetical protein
MNSNRKTAIIVGVLFIIATLAGVLSVVFLVPILNAPDYLSNVSANDNQVIIVVLLELIMIVAIVGIAVMLFPILKKQNEGLALGYVAARIIEVVPFFVGIASLLSLLKVSKEFVIAGAPASSYFQTLGILSIAIIDWTTMIGGHIIFSLTALILNYTLYKSKLVPRWISVWGLIGVPLMLASGVLGMFGLNSFSTIGTFLILPLAIQEMIFAVWLIVKGFNPSAIASGSAKGDIS